MKVVYVADLDLRTGRGPSYRILRMLPRLSALCEITFISIGPAEVEFAELLRKLGVEYAELRHFSMHGWFVTDLKDTIAEMLSIIDSVRPDLVVLAWEAWDLILPLNDSLRSRGIPFTVMMHSTPFVDAPPNPSGSIYLDILRRLFWERRPLVRKYLLARMWQIRPTMQQVTVMCPNEAVEYYLKWYFKEPDLIRSIPGYGNDFGEISKCEAQEKTYDLVYVGAIEEGKGAFELPKLVRELTRYKKDIRLAVMGGFSSPADKERLLDSVTRWKLEDNFVLLGWLAGSSKWAEMKKSRVFVAPFMYSNTFSIPLFEALACGLPAVCYEVPFLYFEFPSPAVLKVPRKSTREMADAIIGLLGNPKRLHDLSAEAVAFCRKAPSWDDAANAEFSAYQLITHRERAP